MIRRDLRDLRTEAERADDRRIAAEREALEARHIAPHILVVDAADEHRLELAAHRDVALVARRIHIREIVRDRIRPLRLLDHAGSRRIKTTPHVLSLPSHLASAAASHLP